MIRGLNVLTGFILALVGLIVTFATFTVNGWTVLAAVGVLMLAGDLYIERVQAYRAWQNSLQRKGT